MLNASVVLSSGKSAKPSVKLKILIARQNEGDSYA